MTIKFTMMIQIATAINEPNNPLHRIGGFSESWYYPGTNIQACLNEAFGMPGGGAGAFPHLCPARAALLPIGGAIVGQRVQLVDPTGPSQSLQNQFPATLNLTTNVPQAALLCKVPGVGVANIRRVILRGLPVIELTEGEFIPGPAYTVALNDFKFSLGAWLFRGRDLSQPRLPIDTIDATGHVQLSVNVPYAVMDKVRILRSKDSGGNLRGGRFTVMAVGPGIGQFTINNWPYGATIGGTARKDLVVYPVVDAANFVVGRSITRRVGRPFTQFHGRRSKRR